MMDRDQSKRLWRGICRSWQMNTGHLMLVLSYLETQTSTLERHLGKNTTADVLFLCGLMLYVLRAKTKTSLAERGES